MKFVFNQDPTSVQRKLSQFTNDLEGAFAQPLKFNIYDTEFYSQVDGSIDFGRTSSCFQIMSDDHVVDLETSKSIFNNNESDLKDLYDAYNIVQVEVRNVAFCTFFFSFVLLSLVNFRDVLKCLLRERFSGSKLVSWPSQPSLASLHSLPLSPYVVFIQSKQIFAPFSSGYIIT